MSHSKFSRSAVALGTAATLALIGVGTASADPVQPGTETPGVQPGTETPSAPDTDDTTTTPVIDDGVQPGTETPVVDTPDPEPAPVPDDGVQPGTDTPEVPAEPVTPPVEDTTPVTPAQPVEDTTPVAPAEPVEQPVDDTPVAPAQPVEDTAPVAPAEPVEQPVDDTAPVAPAQPVEDTTPVVPAEPVAPAPEVLSETTVSAYGPGFDLAAHNVTVPYRSTTTVSGTVNGTDIDVPSVTVGQIGNGVAEIGVGDGELTSVSLPDPVSTLVDTANTIGAQTSDAVSTLIPPTGEFSVDVTLGDDSAGAHADWSRQV